jgi:Ser/Thr protein kinase RdoA (MazF antagonist)
MRGMSETQHPYALLSQDRLIDWLESLDIDTDYRIYPLNSYENRVYRVGIEDSQPIVVKVYRPGRWNEAQIREELAYTQQLSDDDISVVPALEVKGDILHERDGFFFTCFPMRAGHALELDDPGKLYRIGQMLGRMHNCGQLDAFITRPHLSLIEPIVQAQQFFSASDLIPDSIRANYLSTLAALEGLMRPFQTVLETTDQFRIHGDFHAGNILTRDENILLVDFDDTVMGPAMQDIWKLLSGPETEQQQQLNELEQGYQQFRAFPRTEVKLIEALRTTHMVRHNLWIARRWSDPAFPFAFPWLGTERYWGEHLLQLREQWANLQDIEL